MNRMRQFPIQLIFFAILCISVLGCTNNNSIKSHSNYENKILTIPLYVELAKRVGTNFKIIDRATGFIYEENSKNYLVSNWHVFSGRNPHTLKPDFDTSLVVDEKIIPYDSSDPDFMIVYYHTINKSLYSKACLIKNKSGYKFWYEHPDKHKCDLALVEIDLNELPLDSLIITKVRPENILTSVIEPKMFSILGYPRGQKSYNQFPVILDAKMLTIIGSQSYTLSYKAFTERGMSGSPILEWDDELNFKILGVHAQGINDSIKIGFQFNEIKSILSNNNR